jgi:hypothetical protein
MINYILALIGKKEWSTEKIRSAVSGRQVGWILLILKNGTPSQKTLALNLLSNQKVDSPRVMKTLIHIVQADFLDQAQLALEILQKNKSYHPKLSRQVFESEKILKERKRRTTNRKLTAISFHAKPHKGVIFDKSKMKNLERLRQQLKKGMR